MTFTLKQEPFTDDRYVDALGRTCIGRTLELVEENVDTKPKTPAEALTSKQRDMLQAMWEVVDELGDSPLTELTAIAVAERFAARHPNIDPENTRKNLPRTLRSICVRLVEIGKLEKRADLHSLCSDECIGLLVEAEIRVADFDTIDYEF